MSFRSLLLATAVALVFCVTAPAQAKSCSANEPDIACTAQGAIRGVIEGETLAFKGVPYAKPPIGPLRWRPTEPPAPWNGVRDGSRFSAMCPQIVNKQVVGDEDCLTLNIWRPRDAQADRLPVMVWLTGGGNHGLSGQGTAGFGGLNYSGEKLAREGVVFVSFNIRLGALGFLAHPALDAERREKVSGNYGNLDQIAMLRWLRSNIAAFGGDPNRIFLFGTSAGGGSICALMTSPMARGLFHGAAMQSSVPTGCELPTLAEVQARTGARVVKALACDHASDTASCLRGKSMTEVVSAVPASTNVFPRIYGPNMDGHVFPDQPLKIIARRAHAAMPVIIGSTTDETLGWVRGGTPIVDAASYAAEVEKVFGNALRDRVLAAYPLSRYETPLEAFVRLTTDAQFTCTSRRVARIFASAQKAPVYRYLFAHQMENDSQLRAIRANHTIEHAFLFPGRGRYQPTADDLTVKQRMITYWTRAAREGNPNGGGNPSWPAVTRDKDVFLEIGVSTNAAQGQGGANCDFWDTVTLPWPHL
jgi:para-nitrobenzyl esterase